MAGRTRGGHARATPSRALLLALLGNQWQGRNPDVDAGRDLAAATTTFVDVLGRAGAAEAAVRATLGRGVSVGLLDRHRRGRSAYFSPTVATRRLLAEGARRLHHEPPVRDDWDGRWTLLAYSLPESRRDDRHQLRRRLAWEGFGSLRDGIGSRPDTWTWWSSRPTWGSPTTSTPSRPVPWAPAVRSRWRARRGTSTPSPSAIGTSSRCGTNLNPLSHLPDDLARSLWLVTQWRQLVLEDPMLPVDLLPGDWPATTARTRFDAWYARYETSASHLFDDALDALTAPATAS